MRRFNQRSWLVLLIVAVALAACSGAPATTAPVATSAPVAAATAVPAPTTAPTATSAPTIAPTATTAPTATSAPTATPAPIVASSNACLVGTWELSDMSVYMQSIMAKSGSPVSFVGQTGRIVYVFGADGTAKVDAQDFTMKLSMAVQKLAFDLNVVISGAANSNYAATADKITFSNGEMKGLKVSATMNGTELFSDTPAELAAMFGASPDPKYNTFGYQCDATTLTYTPPITDAQPIVMKRANP